MVHISHLTAGFSLASAIVSLALLVVAVNGYRQTHDRLLTFVAAAFAIFAVKSAVVAYSLWTGWIAHGELELFDAVADMATVLMFVLPLLLPRR